MRKLTIIPRFVLLAALAVLAGSLFFLVESYFFVDELQFRSLELYFDRGCVYLDLDRGRPIAAFDHRRWQLLGEDDDPMSDMAFWTRRFLGFSWTKFETAEYAIHIVGIPLWFIAFIASLVLLRGMRNLLATPNG